MFEKILKSNYNIETKSITQIEGGWSALAYIPKIRNYHPIHD